MKTIICRTVEFIPSVYVTSINGTDVVLKSGKSFNKLKVDTAEYNQKSVSTDAGTSLEHIVSISMEQNKDAEQTLLRHNIIFRVTDSSGTTYIIGLIDKPARLSEISKNTNVTNVSFSSKSFAFN